jgi:hypothetical protein
MHRGCLAVQPGNDPEIAFFTECCKFDWSETAEAKVKLGLDYLFERFYDFSRTIAHPGAVLYLYIREQNHTIWQIP